MATGPVQLIVPGFTDSDFHGRIIADVELLRDSDAIRVINSLAVRKDPSGELEAMHLSDLTQDEVIESRTRCSAGSPRC
jgi:hypothetical protein